MLQLVSVVLFLCCNQPQLYNSKMQKEKNWAGEGGANNIKQMLVSRRNSKMKRKTKSIHTRARALPLRDYKTNNTMRLVFGQQRNRFNAPI